MLELPLITQKSFFHIDLTPDSDLPLRILRAYRANCNRMWETDSPDPVWDLMNEDQKMRAKILDEAITKLESR